MKLRRGGAGNVSPVAPALSERGRVIVTKTKLTAVRNWGVSLGVAAMAALINPAVIGCSAESETEWQFDDNDMDAAISGTYDGELNGAPVSVRIKRPTAPASAAPEITVHDLDLGGLQRRSLQCESRSFVRSAGACAPSTSMDFDAEVVSSAGELANGTYNGGFTVWSSELSSGWISFSLGESRSLNADFSNGVISRWYISGVNGEMTELALERSE